MAEGGLTLWGRTNSSNVMKVLWLLDELGVEAVRIDAGGAFGRTKEPAYLAMNPNALVPVLQEADGFTLWESNAILRYLCATRPGGEALYPPDARQRAKVDQWMDWLPSSLGTPMTTVFWNLVRRKGPERDMEACAAAVVEAGRLWRMVEAELEGRDYLCGAFSIADVALGPFLHRWHVMEFERPALPRLAAWHARLRARPGFARHVDVPLT